MSNEVFVQDNNQSVLTNATVTSNGSTILTGYGFQQVALVINVKAAPTGTSPTITFTIQEVDPGDKTTTFGNSATTGSITGTGVTKAVINTTTSGSLQISWTISGASASFTQLYATVVAKATPSTQTVSVVASAASNGLVFGQVTGTANTLSSLRATTYTEQTTNFTGSVKSSSTNDTNSAGTGARSVIITYYDQTGAGPFTETVNLNGTTAVNLVNTNHCFIEKMVVATVGSTSSNQGTISLFTGSGGTGTTVGSIGVGNIVSIGTVGDNRTLWSHHYVASGKTASILTISAGTNGNQSGVVFLRVATPTTANSAEFQITEAIATVSAAGSSSVFRVAGAPLQIAGPARITQYLVPNGSNTTFYGGFEYSEL